MTRQQNTADRVIGHLDRALRTIFGEPLGSGRPDPAESLGEGELTAAGKARSLNLMRVNHAGEVCAQALYQGQELTARHSETREQMEQAAEEENDHLVWCRQRIHELGGHTSLLNPLWYTGSLAIGAFSGLLGDKWSLGFLAETEHQVWRSQYEQAVAQKHADTSMAVLRTVPEIVEREQEVAEAEAKKQETRDRRAARSVEMILTGRTR